MKDESVINILVIVNNIPRLKGRMLGPLLCPPPHPNACKKYNKPNLIYHTIIALRWLPQDLNHWKKKMSQFDLKSWVTGGTKIRPRNPSNWRIFESNLPDIESQFWIDSQYRVNLTQKWLIFSFSDVLNKL